MRVSDFEFDLPKALIAQKPCIPRDAARLLCVDTTLKDAVITDLPRFLDPGDVLVFNPPHDLERNYVKRLIGLPRDTLEMRDKQLYVNGELLYEDYQMHFMVTQGMRDRDTLEVLLEPSSGEAGAINPAAQQLDFYIRSPEANAQNHPSREVFDHFFAMEVTWH